MKYIESGMVVAAGEVVLKGWRGLTLVTQWRVPHTWKKAIRHFMLPWQLSSIFLTYKFYNYMLDVFYYNRGGFV